MNEIAPPAARPHIDTPAALATLRARGAARFDPVRFRFVEALAQRMAGQPDATANAIESRLARALADFNERLDRSEQEGVAPQLQAQPLSSPLAELLAHIGRHSPASSVAPQGESKAMAYFRNTWSALSVDRQLSRSIAQAPENAGPLNSEFLLLQALKAMRAISPEYLRQFMTYADTLLWLDQAEAGRAPARKAAARGERERKRKAGTDKG